MTTPDKRGWRRVWPAAFAVFVAGMLLAGAIYENEQRLQLRQERVEALCVAAREARDAAIEDARGQAQTLVDFAAASAEQDGRPEDAARIREEVGPPYVLEQVEAARDRRPPVDC